MTYPPPEPPPTDPPLPQQPYVPGAYLPGYHMPPGPTPESQANPGAYGYSVPPGPETYGYGTPQPYYPIYPYGYGAPRPTEGLAIASLVVSCAAVFGLCSWGVGGLLGVVGAILGHVARRRIRENGKNGDGMARAGIIVGWILAAIGAVLLVLVVVLFATDKGSTQNT
jgi:hypothetical protein